MARSSLSNSSANLNLSSHQSELLQELIMSGAQMARTISYLDKKYELPVYSTRPVERWSQALMQLAESLL